MAEILLSLTIIGVVAAITLPSLTGNINERTWNTQRKALYSRMSQAIALMPALNSFSNTEAFVTGGLSKVLKINNICSADKISDCGINSTFVDLFGSKKDLPLDMQTLHSTMISASHAEQGQSWAYRGNNTDVTAFETQNGESLVVYYNPACITNKNDKNWHWAQAIICANFVYDLNGKKGPNTVGKDIGFMTVLHSTDSIVVAPMPYGRWVGSNMTVRQAISACTGSDRDRRLPNIDEASSLYLNRYFTGYSFNNFVTSTKRDNNTYWFQGFKLGIRNYSANYQSGSVLCIYR